MRELAMGVVSIEWNGGVGMVWTVGELYWRGDVEVVEVVVGWRGWRGDSITWRGGSEVAGGYGRVGALTVGEQVGDVV